MRIELASAKFLDDLIKFSETVERGFISLLFYSPWEEIHLSCIELAEKLDLPDFYYVNIFEFPELTCKFKITRAPCLVTMNSKKIQVVDIPSAIIRELKYLNRANLSTARSS